MNRIRITTAALTLCLPALLAPPGLAQDDDIKKEIEELKKGQQEILKEIADIKKQLQARAQPSGPNVAGKIFAIGDNPMRGENTAKLTLLEFTDYQ